MAYKAYNSDDDDNNFRSTVLLIQRLFQTLRYLSHQTGLHNVKGAISA